MKNNYNLYLVDFLGIFGKGTFFHQVSASLVILDFTKSHLNMRDA